MPDNDILSEADYELITSAIKEGGKVWENKILDSVKSKIKHVVRGLQDETCCYCRRDITGEFKMVLDIEHILPKSIYPDLRFTITNLAIACKKCNMYVKKDDVSFIVDKTKLVSSYFDSKHYKFIHPNLDKYDNFLSRISVSIGQKRFTKYLVVNKQSKGSYTYTYFKLDEFERDDLDILQGVADEQVDANRIGEELSAKISSMLKS